jgi:hypothetical protein
VTKTVTGIPVRDQKGDVLTLYEIWDRPRLFGLIADHRLELPTGEKVGELNRDHFVVVATGQHLRRIMK